MSVLVPWLTMPDSCITCPLEERCPTLKAEDNAWDYADKRCEKCELTETSKRGKWIDKPTKGVRYICSECTGRFNYQWKYCPNCGADMRGDSDE